MNNWDLKFNNQYRLQLYQKKKMKHLGINLTKYVQNLYVENSKTLIKEIQENLNRYSVLMDWKTQ